MAPRCFGTAIEIARNRDGAEYQKVFGAFQKVVLIVHPASEFSLPPVFLFEEYPAALLRGYGRAGFIGKRKDKWVSTGLVARPVLILFLIQFDQTITALKLPTRTCRLKQRLDSAKKIFLHDQIPDDQDKSDQKDTHHNLYYRFRMINRGQ